MVKRMGVGGWRRGLTPSLAARVKVLNNWLNPLLALLQVWEEEGQGDVKKGQEADEGLSLLFNSSKGK